MQESKKDLLRMISDDGRVEDLFRELEDLEDVTPVSRIKNDLLALEFFERVGSKKGSG